VTPAIAPNLWSAGCGLGIRHDPGISAAGPFVGVGFGQKPFAAFGLIVRSEVGSSPWCSAYTVEGGGIVNLRLLSDTGMPGTECNPV
jgi:hypothetical protein